MRPRQLSKAARRLAGAIGLAGTAYAIRDVASLWSLATYAESESRFSPGSGHAGV